MSEKKKWRILYPILALTLIFGINFAGRYWEDINWVGDNRPADQVVFETRLSNFLKEYNGFARSGTKAELCRQAWQWAKEYARTNGMEIEKWRGRVDPAGFAVHQGEIELVIASRYSSRKIWYHGHISKQLAADPALTEINSGDKIVFSGRFKPSRWNEGLAVKVPYGTTQTEKSLLEDPDFLIEIYKVNRVRD